MKQARPPLVPWRELDAATQAAWKARVPRSNWPPDFDAPTVRFYADGSGYRDAGFFLGKKP